MELTAFKTIPEELIRIIIDYARPTYPYMEELKVLGKNYHREWKHYFNYNPYIKQMETLKREMAELPWLNADTEMMGLMTLPKYKRAYHRKLWTFYKIFGLYVELSEGTREMKIFSNVKDVLDIYGMNARDMIFYDDDWRNVSTIMLRELEADREIEEAMY